MLDGHTSPTNVGEPKTNGNGTQKEIVMKEGKTDIIFEKGDVILNLLTITSISNDEDFGTEYGIVVNDALIAKELYVHLTNKNNIKHWQDNQDVWYIGHNVLVNYLTEKFKAPQGRTEKLNFFNSISFNLNKIKSKNTLPSEVNIFHNYIKKKVDDPINPIKILSFQQNKKEQSETFYKNIKIYDRGKEIKFDSEFRFATYILKESTIADPSGDIPNLFKEDNKKEENSDKKDKYEFPGFNSRGNDNKDKNQKLEKEGIKQIMYLENKLHTTLYEYMKEGLSTEEKTKLYNKAINIGSAINTIMDNLTDECQEQARQLGLFKKHDVGIENIDLERAKISVTKAMDEDFWA